MNSAQNNSTSSSPFQTTLSPSGNLQENIKPPPSPNISPSFNISYNTLNNKIYSKNNINKISEIFTSNDTQLPIQHTPHTTTKTKKSRLFFTEDQKKELKKHFEVDPYPSQKQVDDLALKLKVTPKTVVNWFHNHRMRAKHTASTQGVYTLCRNYTDTQLYIEGFKNNNNNNHQNNKNNNNNENENEQFIVSISDETSRYQSIMGDNQDAKSVSQDSLTCDTTFADEEVIRKNDDEDDDSDGTELNDDKRINKTEDEEEDENKKRDGGKHGKDNIQGFFDNGENLPMTLDNNSNDNNKNNNNNNVNNNSEEVWLGSNKRKRSRPLKVSDNLI